MPQKPRCKRCPSCKKEFPKSEEFFYYTRGKCGTYCKPCERLKHKLSKYKLSEREYQQFVRQADGCCEICKEFAFSRLVIDHCHQTGAVRGLLCYRCNMGLGFFRDSPGVLENATKYLKRDLVLTKKKKQRSSAYEILPAVRGSLLRSKI